MQVPLETIKLASVMILFWSNVCMPMVFIKITFVNGEHELRIRWGNLLLEQDQIDRVQLEIVRFWSNEAQGSIDHFLTEIENKWNLTDFIYLIYTVSLNGFFLFSVSSIKSNFDRRTSNQF